MNTDIIFCCPETKVKLTLTEHGYKRSDGKIYPIKNGIPCFLGGSIEKESLIQKEHYDRVAENYQKNLSYPHTQAYTEYLDNVLKDVNHGAALGNMVELCCGTGESFSLCPNFSKGIGIDISMAMLEKATAQNSNSNVTFAQADVLHLPLEDNSIDTIVMLGGIHHIPDRKSLFAEIFRVLKPEGRFVFREPLNDFILWRVLRFVIYRISPGLDAGTERPLRKNETIPLLEDAGFSDIVWRPAGLFGFCIFMNSDILVFNRLFQYIPKIKAIVRASAFLDDLLLRIPLLKNSGLQVVGSAVKKSQLPQGK